jgi:predicted nuclease of restriction endonuclease-like (RecB) superfamily
MSTEDVINIEKLVSSIQETNHYFLNQAQKQVNTALTVRNWVIGFYIVEYEQYGNDRAEYGQKLYKEISNKLKTGGLSSIRERHLYLCKDFYKAYPNILRTASAKLYLSDNQFNTILQTVSAKCLEGPLDQVKISPFQTDPESLLNKLSFSHFIELLKSDTAIKRTFYEMETIKNNWSVRELQRALNSMLYERTGLSTDKESVLKGIVKEQPLKPEDVFRNPYLLEFLGLEEKSIYTESDLEEAIISHLQTFLLEMGSGFCFEGRQKRITFDNTHYRIDLVFYHRVLKCHVLIDLKIGEFTHADAGQMNVYLNYYKENEMNRGDKPPIGIILCASKNENLVRYATTGNPRKVFVSKYLINLPSENELANIIKEEQYKLK